eukprot:TRINITY_DN3975_c0_g1_i2.p1 TRINITY_DN3975_c0_g1~~TRINITY_DN3975_c0_g1_i2.p1  ORF type:complete len:265 (-),score=85.94 TRINITY_DN3975_c0_g1_i2:89-883(-)
MAVTVSAESDISRRITRSSIKDVDFPSSPAAATTPTKSSKKSKSKKKVKFQDPPTKDEVEVKQNNSLISDEGIDMSFSPPSIPASITRPVHKLASQWSYWYSAKNKKVNWSKNQLLICHMSTVEDFWHCYNQVKMASKLPAGQSYSVFKKGIVPDWEDKANVNGGRWMVNFEKTERATSLDQRWMEVLLMSLGEHMDPCVNGVQVCLRGVQDRVEVWVNNTANLRGVAEVGRKLKEHLGVGAVKVVFSIHAEEKEGFKGPCLMI